MPTCEICGEETEQRWKVKLGNSNLKTCKNCKEHGKIIEKEKKKQKKQRTKKKKKKKLGKKELTANYGRKIKKKREERKLTQKELSNKINERESTVRKIEKEVIKPTKKTAKKLEKALDIDLYQKPVKFNEYKKNKKVKSKKTTIGDIIELKKE
ncbi:MAG: multiprotein bridging factor aMBF1 [archaeon]